MTLHRVRHGSHIQRGTRNHGAMNWICQMRRWWKINWRADCWNNRPSDWLSHSWRPIHANSCGSNRRLREGFDRFSRSTSTISLTGDRSLRLWNISAADTGNVMDAWSPPIFVHGVQTNKILLSVAGYLCRSPRHNKIPRNASPITFTVFVQSQEKQPVFWAHELVKLSTSLTSHSVKSHNICNMENNLTWVTSSPLHVS